MLAQDERKSLLVMDRAALTDLQDDASCIDFGTIKAWNLLTRVMTAEFLDLSPTPPSRKRDEFVRFAKNQVSNRPITYACFYSEN